MHDSWRYEKVEDRRQNLYPLLNKFEELTSIRSEIIRKSNLINSLKFPNSRRKTGKQILKDSRDISLCTYKREQSNERMLLVYQKSYFSDNI